VEEDLITPTFKFKRPQLLKKFKHQVRAASGAGAAAAAAAAAAASCPPA